MCVCVCRYVYVYVCIYVGMYLYMCVCMHTNYNHCHIFVYLLLEGRCSNSLYARSRSTTLVLQQGYMNRNTWESQWGTPWQPALSATVNFIYIACLNSR